MKLTLIAVLTAIGVMVFQGLALGGEQQAVYKLDARQDTFYSKFGGRVFHLWCGKAQVFVFKKADGKEGFLVCQTRRTSPNAFTVVRKGRRWVRE